MGGGGSSSGGDAFSTLWNTGSTSGGGYNWGQGIGGGFQALGKGVASGQSGVPQFSTPAINYVNPGGSQLGGLIPQQNTDQEQIFNAILRLLSGGGYG